MNRIRDVLTARGRAFVAAGTTLVLGGLALGFADVTRIGVLLVVLPLLAAVVTRRPVPSIAVHRTVTPARLTVDQTAQVEVVFDNGSARSTPMQLAEERVDYVLGDRPRFVLPRMDARERREVTYQICSHVRGRHRLGPLALRTRDPFGLASVSARLSGTTDVLVLPRVERLGGGRPRGDGLGTEGAIPHMVASHGEDDVSIRSYRDGDDLRRIHWPATAHRAELMVRQEDQPARRRAVLVLDSRSSGHRGSAASGSFEWAVSAVASITVHLCGSGYAVHLVSAETVNDDHAAETVEAGTALESLALAETTSDGGFESVLHAASPLTSAGGLVIAVVTDHDEELLRRTAALRQPGGTGLLLLLDTGTFAGPDVGDGRSGTRATFSQAPASGTVASGMAASGAASARAAAMADLVSAAGWSVRVVGRGTSVAQAFGALTVSAAVGVGMSR